MSRILLTAMILCSVTGVVSAGDSDSWFDLENCAVCVNMTKTPGMLDAIGWEHYATADGMMTVTVVPEKYAESWTAAKAAMGDAMAKMQKGEEAHLCNFCLSLGGLMAKGATMEDFDTIGGEVTLVTATDPAVVEAIHAHATRTQAEMEKMAAEAGQSR